MGQDHALRVIALGQVAQRAAVLAVEFKVNFLAPAKGERIRARGRVIKAGRTISVCSGDAFAVVDGIEKLVARLQSTVMTIRGRGFAD